MNITRLSRDQVKSPVQGGEVESYPVANVQAEQPTLWQRVMLCSARVVNGGDSIGPIMADKKPAAVANERKTSSPSGKIGLEFHKFGPIQKMKLRVYSAVVSAVSAQTYNQVYSEQIQQINKKNADAIPRLLKFRTAKAGTDFVRKMEDLSSKRGKLLEKTQVLELVKDFDND